MFFLNKYMLQSNVHCKLFIFTLTTHLQKINDQILTMYDVEMWIIYNITCTLYMSDIDNNNKKK